MNELELKVLFYTGGPLVVDGVQVGIVSWSVLILIKFKEKSSDTRSLSQQVN